MCKLVPSFPHVVSEDGTQVVKLGSELLLLRYFGGLKLYLLYERSHSMSRHFSVSEHLLDCFKTVSHYVSLAGLELDVSTWLVINSQRS